MNFDGTFEIEDVTTEEAWIGLSDPVLIEEALPGCEFLLAVDEGDVDFDELRERAGGETTSTLPDADPEDVAERAFEEGGRYAALVEIGVGSVKPSFETVITTDHREFPDMSASGEGNAIIRRLNSTRGCTSRRPTTASRSSGRRTPTSSAGSHRWASD